VIVVYDQGNDEWCNFVGQRESIPCYTARHKTKALWQLVIVLYTQWQKIHGAAQTKISRENKKKPTRKSCMNNHYLLHLGRPNPFHPNYVCDILTMTIS
jgi:hypothetical protein